MEEVDFVQLVAVSAVVMGLSHTVAKERLFRPLRERLGGMDTWAGYFVSCPYCVSHWVAFVLVPLTGAYGLRVAVEWGFASAVLDWFLSSILVAVIAAFLRVGFYFVDESQGLIRRRQKAVEKETALLVERGEADQGRIEPGKNQAPEPPALH